MRVSDSVGWVWIVTARSSAVSAASTARAPSAISSPAPGPTMPTPSTRPVSASLAQRLGLGEPAPRDLGVGEDDGRDDDGVERRGPTRDRLGGDLALAHRAVGEHRLARDVADGPDARVGGAAPLVYGDETVRVGPGARRLETELRADGAPPDGDEHAVEGDGVALAEARLDLRSLLVQRRHLRAETDLHEELLAMARERLDEVAVHAGQEAVGHLDERHLAAERGVDLADRKSTRLNSS